MFNNTPFGFSNNCGPLGCNPFSGFNGYNSFNGFGGGNNWCGPNGSPISGWNNSLYGGGINGLHGFGGFGGSNNWNSFGGNSYPNSFAGNSYPNGFNSCPPFGYNNWNSFGTPVNGLGYNNWNGQNYGGQNNYPLASNVPFNGMQQGMGFPGMNWNNAWNGFSSPSTNLGSYFPGNFAGGSPLSGVSNWFSSPWMGYAYPGYTQQHGVVGNGSNPVSSPVNGQYIPNSAFPFPCAPFNVPFQSNGYAPAGQGVNCEAA